MSDETLALLHKHFGEDATIQRRLFGGWRIMMASGGEVDFTGERFENIVGGAHVYRAVISAGKEMWGSLRTNGPAHHILASLAHGEEMDAIIQPIVRDGTTGCLKVFVGVVLFAISTCIAAFYMPLKIAWGAGVIFTGGIMLLINPSWNEAITRNERRRGQHYVDVFPQMHGSDRLAKRDDARRKGLL